MILVISGSRGYHRDEFLPKLDEAIRLSGFRPTKILHGGNMDSVDRLAKAWARLHDLEFDAIAADWEEMERLGIPKKAAGPIRNKKLVAAGDALVALWDGESPGTWDCITQMRRAGKPVFVYRLDGVPHERINAQLGLFPSAPSPRR
jgi:hypothetical protein